jgi:hypothetical protein
VGKISACFWMITFRLWIGNGRSGCGEKARGNWPAVSELARLRNVDKAAISAC